MANNTLIEIIDTTNERNILQERMTILIKNKGTMILITDKGEIKGEEVKNYYTGNQKNQVAVDFEYEGRKYQYPFSRKTGKLYACKLPFNIRLKV